MLKTLSFLCVCFLLNGHHEAEFIDEVSSIHRAWEPACEEFHSLLVDFIPRVFMFNREAETILLPSKTGAGPECPESLCSNRLLPPGGRGACL